MNKLIILFLILISTSVYAWELPYTKMALMIDGMRDDVAAGATISGMLAHYKFNDNAATTNVVDSYSTNTAFSIRNTSVVTTNGLINSALYFNGSSDNVKAGFQPTDSAKGTATNAFSLCAWVRTTAGGCILIFGSIGNLGYCSGLQVRPSDGKIGIENEYDDMMSTVNGKDGNWHHVVSTWDTVKYRLYVDGIDRGVPAAAYTPNIQPGLLGIGYRRTRNDSYFTGSIDDVRVYSRAVASNEVWFLYNSGNGTEAE